MARADMITKLYCKTRTALEFNYESLMAPPIYSIMTPTDVGDLNSIAKSIKLSSDVDKKRRYIDDIMVRRDFKFLAAGTNRMVYKFLEDQSFVSKIAFDRTGIKDNPAELHNQLYLKPYCSKTFETSQCGTFGFMERVQPITSREEFMSISDDIYDLIDEKLIGKYVIEDIGTNYFMNFGLRLGWGPVILDYPYVYELDGDKLYCNNQDPITKEFCLGEIDYDDGFNELHCTKCGRLYKAKELANLKENNEIIQEGRHSKMKVAVKRANRIIGTIGGDDTIIEKPKNIVIPVTTIIPAVRGAGYSDFGKKVQSSYNTEASSDGVDFVHEIAKTIKEEALKPDDIDSVIQEGYVYTTNAVKDADGQYITVVPVLTRRPHIEPSVVVTEKESEEVSDKIDEVVENQEEKITDTFKENSEVASEEARSESPDYVEEEVVNVDEKSEITDEEIAIEDAVDEDVINRIAGTKNQQRSKRFDNDFYAR